MIISHKLKLIYIKLDKVASTSFELALSQYCGNDDIIAPLPEKIEAIRSSLGMLGCQNYEYLKHKLRKFYFNKKIYHDPSYINPSFNSIPQYWIDLEHAHAIQIRSIIPQKIWNDYLKIATIRCPYDTAISLYYFRKYQQIIPASRDFESYIRNYTKDKWLIYFPGIHINKKLVPDFLIRYEHLDKDIKKLEQQINCPGLSDTFRNIHAYENIRKKNTQPYRIYTKYPQAKLLIDDLLYQQQNNYEFISTYWPMYKTELENAIMKYKKNPIWFSLTRLYTSASRCGKIRTPPIFRDIFRL